MACQHALLVSTAMTLLAAVVVADDAGSADTRAKKFIEAHVAKIKPLEKSAGIAWWDANTSGKDEDFQRKEEAQNKIDAVLSDPVAFRELKSIKESGRVTDKLLARQIDVIYLGYLEKQVDPLLLREMVSKSNAIEKAFNVYRAEVDGKKLTENDVRKVLKEAKNSDERRKTWEGSKGVGAVVEKLEDRAIEPDLEVVGLVLDGRRLRRRQRCWKLQGFECLRNFRLLAIDFWNIRINRGLGIGCLRA